MTTSTGDAINDFLVHAHAAPFFSGPLGCGCLVELSWEKRIVGDIDVTYCPLHAQAPTMLEALRSFVAHTEGAYDNDTDYMETVLTENHPWRTARAILGLCHLEGAWVSGSARVSGSAQHTPGPWAVCTQYYPELGRNRFTPYIVDAQGRNVAAALLNVPDAEHEANTRLIAAAPDLLKALKGLVQSVQGDGHVGASVTQARAAITAATGRP